MTLINQETFSAVVSENIEEFEMDINEAISDAVQQFSAQGICLDNIVRDDLLYIDGGIDHPLLKALSNLKKYLETKENDWRINDLHTIRLYCMKGFCYRALLASNNAWDPLYDICVKSTQSNEQFITEHLSFTLEVLQKFCDKQPDVVTHDGRKQFVSILSDHMENDAICAKVLKLISVTCKMHEASRQAYVELSVIPLLSKALDIYCSKNKMVIIEACAALRILATDDDMRATFGKAHDNARIIVTEHHALEKILNICKEYSNDEEVIAEMFQTMSRLAVRNEFCQQIYDLGGLDIMINALQNHTSCKSLVSESLTVLKALAGNDTVKEAMVNAGAVEYVIEHMLKHIRHAGVIEGGCAALGAIALRVPQNCQRIITAGGAEAIIKGMQIHEKVANIQKKGCRALRNLVARSPNLQSIILELGAETVILKSTKLHRDCQDEAKGALRDLGCDVTLTELWTGKGQGINH